MIVGKILRKIGSFLKLLKFKSHGKKCSVGKRFFGHYKNIKIGSNCHIGDNNTFLCLLAPIEIGNYFMSGPNVTFVTGNHRIDVVGKRMEEITDEMKLPENDQKFIVEDDVWIGTNSTILKGVVLREGTVVGAGSVVTKSTEPYSIIAGNPARLIRYRFDKNTIIEHQNLIKNK